MTDQEAAAERLRAFVREHQHGGCKMFSQGSACQCPLCDVDRLVEVASQDNGSALSKSSRAAKGEPNVTKSIAEVQS